MDFLKQKGPLAREFCNTLIYIISLVSLKPSSLQRVLTELQWNGMWFFSLAFFAVIFMEMLSDFLLVTDRCTAWKALNGNVSEAEFHNLQQIVLCENQKVSIEKKLASTILLVLMICATAAFVWFTCNRQISRRIKKHLWLSNRSWARDVHSFGILHSWGALAGKSCSAQASSIWLIAGAFRRTQSK